MDKDDKLGREVAEQIGKTYEEHSLELTCAILISMHGKEAVKRTVWRLCYEYDQWDKEFGEGLP